MNHVGTFAVYWLVFFSIPVGYFTPAIVAVARKNPNRGPVVVVDLLLGWTIVGWIVAMAMALQGKKTAPAGLAR